MKKRYKPMPKFLPKGLDLYKMLGIMKEIMKDKKEGSKMESKTKTEPEILPDESCEDIQPVDTTMKKSSIGRRKGPYSNW